MNQMKTIRLGDSGPAVEDIQQRLALIDCMEESQVDASFGTATADAVRKFCRLIGINETSEVDSHVWAALVDATYNLGDRTLYLKMPHFHGHDVLELQQALGALGFSCGPEDGIFGAHTEDALRKFQMNLGLPSDGIAGAYTYSALHNLEHSWVGKDALADARPLGFARAADVLEEHALCLFGIDEFTRSVASRISNLALATNPASKIVSADTLSVTPGDDMLLVQVTTKPVNDSTPSVTYEYEETLTQRLKGAIQMAHATHPLRIRVILPGECWNDAGPSRSAQHFAITLLDAICSAL